MKIHCEICNAYIGTNVGTRRCGCHVIELGPTKAETLRERLARDEAEYTDELEGARLRRVKAAGDKGPWYITCGYCGKQKAVAWSKLHHTKYCDRECTMKGRYGSTAMDDSKIAKARKEVAIVCGSTNDLER